MATLLELIHAAQSARGQASAPRMPIQVYTPPPPPRSRGQAPRASTARRATAPAPAGRGGSRGRGGGSGGGGNRGGSRVDQLLSAFANTPEAQEQAMAPYRRQLEAEQARLKEEAKPDGFWGSGLGKGLGIVLNNPITKNLLVPIGALQTGGKAITLGLEELAKATPDWFEELPGIGGGLLQRVDEDRVRKDTRSNWEKLSPTSSYGYGEIAESTGNKWLDRFQGLAGDVALDPLTYVGAGATRVIPEAAKVAEATSLAEKSAEASRLASEAADAARAASAAERASRVAEAQRLADEAQTAQRAASEAADAARVGKEVVLPPDRASRAQIVGEYATRVGREEFDRLAPELQKGVSRGFLNMSPEAQRALGIQRAGLRLRGGGPIIPGTRRIAQGLGEAMGGVRKVTNMIPGDESRLRNFRTPKGLEESASVLGRERAGDVYTAATDFGVRSALRRGAGAAEAQGNRILKDATKAIRSVGGESARRQLLLEAESLPEPNVVNTLFKDLLESFERVTGRVISPEFKLNPDTYVPHILDPKFRRVLKRARTMGGEEASRAQAFIEKAGIAADDLLEGSGHLEAARELKAGKEFELGGALVRIEDDTIAGLNANESLRAAFPGYTGKFYLDDPAQIGEAYVSSLSRQAGRDIALKELADSPNELAQRISGKLQEAVEQQGAVLGQRGPGRSVEALRQGFTPGGEAPTPAPHLPGQTATGDEVRLYRGEALAPDPGPGLPGWMEGNPELAARAAVEGRWFHPDINVARTYPMNRDPGVGNRLRYIDVPAEAIPGYQQFDEATKALSRDPGEVLIPPELMGQVQDVPEWWDVADQYLSPGGRRASQDTISARDKWITSEGKKIVRSMEKDVKETAEAARKTLEDVNTNMYEGLKADVAGYDVRIKEINANIKTLGKEVDRDLGKITSDNLDDVTSIITRIEKHIDDATQELKSKSSSWRQRGTRARRKVEADLQRQLRELRATRLKADRLVDRAPAALKAEIAARRALLDEPVARAQRALLQAEQAVPVPHAQDRVDWANQVVGGAKQNTPEFEQLTNSYRIAVQQMEATRSAARTRGGKILKADQEAIDQAARAVRDAEAQMRGVTKRYSPYDDAMNEITRLREAGTLSAKDRRRMIKLGKDFSSGQFAEERKARAVIADMEKYRLDLAEATKAETAELKAAHTKRATTVEAMIKGPGGERIVPPDTDVFRQGRKFVPADQARAGELYATETETMWAREGGKMVPLVKGKKVQVPPLRHETEALQKLEAANVTGQPIREAAAARARKAEEAATAAYPENLAQGQEAASAAVKAAAEKELNPISKRQGIMRDIDTALTDKRTMVIKRDQARALRDRLKRAKPSKYTDLEQTLDEIDSVAKANPLLDNDALNATEALLQNHRTQIQRTKRVAMTAKDQKRLVDAAFNGNIGEMVIPALNNNWKAFHNGPLAGGDIIMQRELHRRFTNMWELSKEPSLFGRTFNSLTNLFKTYATLSPGFHVRNALSGIFMNTSDGVKLARQLEGVQLWRKFASEDKTWLSKQPQRIQDAFEAAFASGAGGQFIESGMLGKSSSRFETWASIYNKMSDNMWTRASKRAGSWVEGAMRMGMALDSIDRGESIGNALERITRIHFDYGQVSQLDEAAKRLIPFWTFMSRNLPMQVQQMWVNPRLYVYLEDFQNNFSEEPPPFTPDYWNRLDYWNTGEEVGGRPLFAAPDLGYTRVQADLESMGKFLSGDMGAALSNVNPLIAASMDFANKRDSFYDRSYGPKDYTSQSGIAGVPLTALATILGQTNEAGQVSDNFTNYLSSLFPTFNQAQRLTPQAFGGGGDPLRQAEAIARWSGVPARLLSPEQQQAEMWRRFIDQRDELERQQAMQESLLTGGR